MTPAHETHDPAFTTSEAQKKRKFLFGRSTTGTAEEAVSTDDLAARVNSLTSDIDHLVDTAQQNAEAATEREYPNGPPPSTSTRAQTTPGATEVRIAHPVPGVMEVTLPGEPEPVDSMPIPQESAPADIPATSVDHLAVDTHRILESVESEALRVRTLIAQQLQHAEREVTAMREQAVSDATAIRDNAQDQARILLNEVESIITDSQRSGQDILTRAESDAKALRQEATEVIAAARDEARHIVDVARREGEEILAEQRRIATARAREGMREQDRLREQIGRLEERRRQVLESLEPLVNQLSQLVPAAMPAINDGARIQAVPDPE